MVNDEMPLAWKLLAWIKVKEPVDTKKLEELVKKTGLSSQVLATELIRLERGYHEGNLILVEMLDEYESESANPNLPSEEFQMGLTELNLNKIKKITVELKGIEQLWKLAKNGSIKEKEEISIGKYNFTFCTGNI